MLNTKCARCARKKRNKNDTVQKQLSFVTEVFAQSGKFLWEGGKFLTPNVLPCTLNPAKELRVNPPRPCGNLVHNFLVKCHFGSKSHPSDKDSVIKILKLFCQGISSCSGGD